MEEELTRLSSWLGVGLGAHRLRRAGRLCVDGVGAGFRGFRGFRGGGSLNGFHTPSQGVQERCVLWMYAWPQIHIHGLAS